MWLLVCMLLTAVATSCGSDKDDEPVVPETNVSPIVGTWVYNAPIEQGYYDTYTLVFSNDYTGYIRNEYGSRTAITEQMNFDWSLNMTSTGRYLLSVIYKSGDRDMDGPFSGGYAQYNTTVTIAGSTLSIMTGESTVMLFSKR